MVLTLFLPGLAALFSTFVSTVIFLYHYPVSNSQSLDSIQIFLIAVISTILTAFTYFNLGLLNVFSAAYL